MIRPGASSAIILLASRSLSHTSLIERVLTVMACGSGSAGGNKSSGQKPTAAAVSAISPSSSRPGARAADGDPPPVADLKAQISQLSDSSPPQPQHPR